MSSTVLLLSFVDSLLLVYTIARSRTIAPDSRERSRYPGCFATDTDQGTVKMKVIPHRLLADTTATGENARRPAFTSRSHGHLQCMVTRALHRTHNMLSDKKTGRAASARIERREEKEDGQRRGRWKRACSSDAVVQLIVQRARCYRWIYTIPPSSEKFQTNERPVCWVNIRVCD